MPKNNVEQYRVFGNPITHSRSPFIHHAFAKNTNQSLHYDKKFVELDGFDDAVNAFIIEGGKGINVTVPFKEQALKIANKLSKRAELAGAVNTLCFKDGYIYGDNTDGEGLVQDLIRNNIQLHNAKILLLGAGGAAKGVLLPLLEQHPLTITIVNRTVSKAEALSEKVNQYIGVEKVLFCGFNELKNNKFDVIINATSASLSGALPPIPANIVNNKVTCYDMVYGKNLTPFLLWATHNNAKKVIDGLGMLVEQAAISFELWTKEKPDVDEVLSSLRKSIAAE